MLKVSRGLEIKRCKIMFEKSMLSTLVTLRKIAHATEDVKGLKKVSHENDGPREKLPVWLAHQFDKGLCGILDNSIKVKLGEVFGKFL